MFPLATIGYEGASLAAVIARLWAASVSLVLDVRAIAASRRPGFSKTTLSASLAEAGIDYRHLRALGTPKSGRQAARAYMFFDVDMTWATELRKKLSVL